MKTWILTVTIIVVQITFLSSCINAISEEENSTPKTLFDEKSVPVAVPVVTPEEAEEANDFACTLYLASKNNKMTIVEGTLEKRSELPDPANSDYPDCRFTAQFTGEAILEGSQCPKDIQLIVDGFQNYKILESNSIKEGDRLQLTLLPFDELNNEQQSIQQADDLYLFDLERYYVCGIKSISTFTDIFDKYPNPIPFSGKNQYVSVFEREINPPLSNELKEIQKECIERDLKKINGILLPYTERVKQETNQKFQTAWEKDKAKDPPGYNRINGMVWRNIDNSYWGLPESHVLIPKYYPIYKYNLDAFVALRDYLESQGVQLIISLVPDLYDISARVINKDFKNTPDFLTALTVKELLENGIEAIYSSQDIITNYNRYEYAFFYPDNIHASDTTQDVSCDIISERLKRFEIGKNMDESLFVLGNGVNFYKYSWPSNCDIGEHEEGKVINNISVTYDGKKIQRDENSPILVIGNSMIQLPMSSPESFPSVLSAKTSHSIDWYRVNSVGPFTTVIQSIFNNPTKYLKNKKVVIFHIDTRTIHNRQKYTNIREIDKQMLLLSEKTLSNSFKTNNNFFSSPEGYNNLKNALFVNIPDNGSYLLLETEEQPDNQEKVVVIPVCAKAGINATITVNDTTVDIPQSHLYNNNWSKIIIPISSNVSNIKITVSGKPNDIIAVGEIQIYK